MSKIKPCLWFDTRAEEAAKFYTSIFKNSKIGRIARYGDSGSAVSGLPAGTVMTVEFELDGQKFLGLNGGPQFKFTEAVSFMVDCATQEEIDYFWEKLSEGGEPGPCGWLKDKFGLSWQIIPSSIGRLTGSGNANKTEKVMAALLKMGKLDVAELTRAYEEG